jgi:hypothetical protein
MPTHRLLAFYREEGPDDRGRQLSQILGKDDEWLEYTHDYVQWLFPLRERSGSNPSAPLLDDEFAATFRHDQKLRTNMDAALRRMLSFYGLRRRGDRIEKASNWERRKHDWFTDPTHNDLRITRILRCLSTLGQQRDAEQLLTCLVALRRSEPDCGFTDDVLAYWRSAVRSGNDA